MSQTSSRTSTLVRSEVPDAEAHRIQLSWLLKLRWVMIGGQFVTILVVDRALHIALPLLPLFAILAIEVLSNAACSVAVRRVPAVKQWMLGSLMAADVLLFTGLLRLTGGPLNPFSFLYLVHIALAAVVLRTRWTWGLVALSSGCFAALFLDGGSLEHMVDPHMAHAHAGHMQSGASGPVAMHLQGMWVAFGVAAAFIVYFVSRVTRDLGEREQELARARSSAARAERLASLATLAAGAAHELATPLSTIAVVAKELERDLERGKSGPEIGADARAIREEVERCREILFRMAADAGPSPGDGFARIGVNELIERAVGGLADRTRVAIALDADAAARSLLIPPHATAQALRGVLKNAQQAAADGSEVTLRASSSAGALRIEVRDRGIGMTPEVLARAGEPFYTTKEPGHGMGLGLFVARAVLERLGGALELTSVAQAGTTAVLTIPFDGSN